MLANLMVLAFVGFMVYWWGSQGVFSALLHLVSVIIAGSLALALWEPIVTHLLLNAIAPYAWGVGLVVPFLVILLVVRNLFDYLIKSNVHFHQIINLVAGGFCGLWSGILTAGILMIGLGFMQLGYDIAGYEPYMLGGQGEVVDKPGGSMWLGVEYQAGGFFSMLSTGAFSNGTPLSYEMPKLARQSGEFRLHVDDNASNVAIAGAVTVSAAWVADTPFRAVDDSIGKVIGDKLRQANHKLVVIDTQWQASTPTYDGDNIVRIAPTQITLITRGDEPDSKRALVHPLGASKLDGATGVRQYLPFDDSGACMAGNNPRDSISFIFVIPGDQQVQDLLIRRLRLSPTVQVADDKSFAAMGSLIGKLNPELLAKLTPAPAPAGDGKTGTVGAREGIRTGSLAGAIEVSDVLPFSFSPNHVSGNLEQQGNAVSGGRFTVSIPQGTSVSRANAITAVHCPSSRVLVRVKVDRDKAQSLLGKTRAAAAMLQPIYIEDTANNKWLPMGYAWKKTDADMEISVNQTALIQSAKELPIADLNDTQLLYLYFAINKGASLKSYHVGQTQQELKLDIK
ncbi:MAG: hypothetical protein IT440_08245 [Phycisphaeraceae bacterium]|nr:hypothetical protein [Phycisphaeraceae bacterium]